MEEFVLQPARVRGDRLVVSRKEETLRVDWSGLVKLVGGGHSPSALLLLRRLRRGDFVGERRTDRGRTNFLVGNASGAASVGIGHITKTRPTFEVDVDKVYQIQEASYDVSLKEAS